MKLKLYVYCGPNSAKKSSFFDNYNSSAWAMECKGPVAGSFVSLWYEMISLRERYCNDSLLNFRHFCGLRILCARDKPLWINGRYRLLRIINLVGVYTLIYLYKFLYWLYASQRYWLKVNLNSLSDNLMSQQLHNVILRGDGNCRFIYFEHYYWCR